MRRDDGRTQRARLGVALALIAVVGAGCGGGATRAVTPTTSGTVVKAPTTGAQPDISTWQARTDPHGFTVKTPRGWAVTVPDGHTAVLSSPSDHALVVVRPFIAATPTTADQCVRAAPSSLQTLLPQATLGDVVDLHGSPQQAVASLAFQGDAGTSRAGVMCAVNGYSGMLYAIGAPTATFAKDRPSLVAVLETFTFTGAGGAGSPATAVYTTFTDPLEHAFTVEVPQGWHTSGGMHRFASVDVRPQVDVISADGSIRLRTGDQSVPTFEEPNALLAQAGYGPGMQISNGYGVTFTVATYVPGASFAEQHVRTAWASACPGLAIVDSVDRPQLAAALNQQLASFATAGVQAHVDTGAVAFSCNNGSRGYELAATLRTSSPNLSLWQIYSLYGYVAPAGQVVLAQQALDHMAATYRQDPAWAQSQGAQAVATSRIVAQAGQQIANDISQGYWYRQSVLDQLSNSWSNTILGQQDMVNPTTGEQYKVASGYNYYWAGPTGQIAGTDTGQPPDINVTQLDQLPLNG